MIRYFTGVLIAALASSATAAPSAVDHEYDSIPVLVSFQLKAPAMTKLWPGDTAGVSASQEIASRLARELESEFNYWRFRADEDGFGNGSSIRLRLFAEQRYNKLELRVELAHSGRIETFDPINLWEAAEFPRKINARKEQAQSDISEECLGNLKKRKERFVNFLSSYVPLARGGQWRKARGKDLSVVLPLPWSKFNALRFSEFRLLCRRTQGVARANMSRANGRLNAVGTGESREYTLVKEEMEPYWAVSARVQDLVVSGREVALIWNEASQYDLELVFLHKKIESPFIDDN